jgi:O-antigen/teichoic acid export membrane protein
MAGVSRSKAAFWGAVSSQVFMVVSMLVSIVSTPLMVKYLDKDAYGLSILFFQIINYLSLFDFGLSTALNRNLALHRGDDDYNKSMVNKIMSTGIFTAMGFAVFVFLLGLICAPLLPSVYDLRPDLAAPAVPIVITLSLLVGGQFIQRGLTGIFYAHHRQPLIGTPYFLVSMAGSGLTILLLSRGIGLWTFVYVNIFQFAVNLIVQIFLLRKYYPDLQINVRNFDKVLVRSMMSYGIFMFLHGVATQIILFTDRMVIGKVLTLAMVSIFSITVRIPEVGMNLLSSILGNALPAVAEIVVHEGNDSARYHFNRMMILMVSLSLLTFWLMLALDEWFINLWVGPDFFAGKSVLILALVIMIQQTITRTGVFFLDAKGIVRASSFMSMIEAVLNITASIILGKKMGMTGVLLGTIVASAATTMWYVPHLLRKHLGISLRDYLFTSLAKPIVGISIMGLACYWVVGYVYPMFTNSWLYFLMTSVVAGGILAGYVWIFCLRTVMAQYVPPPLRRFLLVPFASFPSF